MDCKKKKKKLNSADPVSQFIHEMSKLKPLRFPEANKPKGFKIGSWNIGAGEKVKLQLESILMDESFDALCVQEAFGSTETNWYKLSLNTNYHYMFSKPSILGSFMRKSPKRGLELIISNS